MSRKDEMPAFDIKLMLEDLKGEVCDAVDQAIKSIHGRMDHVENSMIHLRGGCERAPLEEFD